MWENFNEENNNGIFYIYIYIYIYIEREREREREREVFQFFSPLSLPFSEAWWKHHLTSTNHHGRLLEVDKFVHIIYLIVYAQMIFDDLLYCIKIIELFENFTSYCWRWQKELLGENRKRHPTRLVLVNFKFKISLRTSDPIKKHKIWMVLTWTTKGEKVKKTKLWRNFYRYIYPIINFTRNLDDLHLDQLYPWI